MKWLTTYKREVERTEQLGIEYQTALDNIITEIKKDDNLSPDRILDIVECIKYIKRNRKRWATGVVSGILSGTVMDFNCIATLPKLSFKPSYIYLSVEDVSQIYYPDVRNALSNQTISIISDTVYMIHLSSVSIYEARGDNAPAYIDKVVAGTYNAGKVKVFEAKLRYNNNAKQTGTCKFNWIAFE